MMEIKAKEKVIKLSDEQKKQVYSLANHMSIETIEKVCPALFEIVSNAERGLLKNELGRVIFHLQKNERLNTRIGLEKLLHAALIVNSNETFEVLESFEQDAKELAEKIKAVL